jgi:mono/diheme cytochrome c family protein
VLVWASSFDGSEEISMKALNIGMILAGVIVLLGHDSNLSPAQAQQDPKADGRTAPGRLAWRLSSRTNRTGGEEKSSTNRPASSTYLGDVLPIFLGKCFRCHNAQTAMLPNWVDYRTAFKDRVEIKRRVWDSWKGAYYKQPMPVQSSPESQAITEEERNIIKDWVDAGARFGVPRPPGRAKSKAERMEAGKPIFATICAACHQATGLGIPNQFPPLAGSDFLNADKNRAIRILFQGLQGEVTVNGRTFNNSMPLLPLTDEDIASALTYVYNSFGNSGKDVTPEEVKAVRAQKQTKIVEQPNLGANRSVAQSPFE